MDATILWVSGLGTEQAVWAGLVGAALFEIVTILGRFGLDLPAAKGTGFIAPLTRGYRIHHGYVGFVLTLPALFLGEPDLLRNGLLVSGISLLVSDAIHHFAVLWPVTGSPELHGRYPGWAWKQAKVLVRERAEGAGRDGF